VVLLNHHGGVEDEAVGGRDLDGRGQDTRGGATDVSEKGGVEILAVIRCLIHFSISKFLFN
jgi:hypothetical protein